MLQVKAERTGWRDLRLSERHRKWGWDCPAVDLDFLFLEYDKGKAVAIVEYKHERAARQKTCHPTYQAIIDLGNRAGIPVIAVRYTDDFSCWRVTALNEKAYLWIPQIIDLTERQWVELLYRIRGYKLPQKVFDELKEI